MQIDHSFVGTKHSTCDKLLKKFIKYVFRVPYLQSARHFLENTVICFTDTLVVCNDQVVEQQTLAMVRRYLTLTLSADIATTSKGSF